ncbi:hypothetical protein HJ171_20695 [Vibrio parahaemolyticus]|uniref:hypothetical protein n=1 Tax=Vibrio parahaemolyticus TaxID=670 RepID=UPI0011201C10|nr:hypothetical protein [Vibrio parahaemolyticus]EJG0884303.1 hypothetical protein [Vibrio parahaemolyticus]MBE3839617.1 hypothetical protein [Vibrio parahaemolyticus]TOA76572.1 hypothetical protein CGK19_22450 [Vibrio parahaemolyticus]TOF29578.1 hypothetical protein CGJ25_18150 [Vibrio parahaemolyticus]
MKVSTLEINKTAMYHGDFTDRKQEFFEACKWLSEEMGFPYKSTRMGDYERLLKTFVNPRAKAPTERDLLDDFYQFMQAATEACQIIRLWNTFKSGEHQGLKDRIKHVMSGKSIRAEAIKKNKKGQNNDPARDFAFELNIASRFLKGGYKVDLTDDCDVVVDIGKDKLYVECKRIKSLKKLGHRIKEASAQIDTRIGKNRKNKFGLIALDVTDILLPEGTVTATSDVRLYDMQIQKAITDFAKDHQDISDKNIGRNVAGVLFEYSSSAFFSDTEKEPSLGFGRAACMSRKASQSKKSLALVTGFIDKIANQNL